MLANLAYNIRPELSIGPLIISILTFLVISFLIILRSSSKDLTGYSVVVSALSALICNSIITVDTLKLSTIVFGVTSPSSYVFYGIYISFAFIPGLIAFHRISKENGGTIGKFVVYFGYFWAFITIAIGLTLTIYVAKHVDLVFYTQENMDHFSTQLTKLASFMYYSGWAFVVAYLVLFVSNSGAYAVTSRNSLIIYTSLNILSVLVNTIIFKLRKDLGTNGDLGLTSFSVTLVFCDITVAIALIIATYYGNLWRYDPKLRDASDGGTEALEVIEGVVRIACFK
ncbi:unnamed protein product [Mucor hiemalis]